MSKKVSWFSAIIAIIILAFLLYFFLPSFGWQSEEVETQDQPASQSEPSGVPEKRINDEGREWSIDDNADLVVMDGEDQIIRFLESQIHPLKVYPGDTQKMRVVVAGDYGISGVRAEIETDNGTKVMELTKTGTIAARDLDPLLAKYKINDRHELIILSDEEALAGREQEISNEESGALIKTARAAASDKEVWEGSWTVQDTTHRDYRTKFIAYDAQGNEKSLFLAWSDPCNFPNKATSGKYIHTDPNCTLSTTAGVENGDFEMSENSSLTLNTGGSLVYNPGESILLPGGTITLTAPNSGGGLKKGYLWAEDADSDGYAPGVNRIFTSDTNPPAGAPEYRRQNTLIGTEIDCNDESNSVYPGQTQYFDYETNGSFDYNCNGSVDYQYSYTCQPTTACDGTGLQIFDSNGVDVTCTGANPEIPVPTNVCWYNKENMPSLPSCGSLIELLSVINDDTCLDKEGVCQANLVESLNEVYVLCR